MSRFTRSRNYRHAGSSGFPYRVHRCIVCSREAIGTGPDGENYCASHMPVDYHQLALEEFRAIAKLVGAEEADRLQDAAFPGPIGSTLINDREWYLWAKTTRLSIEHTIAPPISKCSEPG